MDGLGDSGVDAGTATTNNNNKTDGNNNNVYFGFDDPERISPPILQMTDVVFGYTPNKLILKGLSFDLQMDSKVAVVGPNGAGKKTTIKSGGGGSDLLILSHYYQPCGAF